MRILLQNNVYDVLSSLSLIKCCQLPIFVNHLADQHGGGQGRQSVFGSVAQPGKLVGLIFNVTQICVTYQ